MKCKTSYNFQTDNFRKKFDIAVIVIQLSRLYRVYNTGQKQLWAKLHRSVDKELYYDNIKS